jgi:hypothetical protein
MKRRKRLEQRLIEREASNAEPKKTTVTQKVKEFAKEAVEKVGEVLHAAAEKVKGTDK